MFMQASRDSGYWFITMLALRGRAFAKWPMAIYTVYTVLIVVFMQVEALPGLIPQFPCFLDRVPSLITRR